MPIKTFNNSNDAAIYASKHTRCRIKSASITRKQTDEEKERGDPPKVERQWRVITHNRDREI